MKEWKKERKKKKERINVWKIERKKDLNEWKKKRKKGRKRLFVGWLFF